MTMFTLIICLHAKAFETGEHYHMNIKIVNIIPEHSNLNRELDITQKTPQVYLHHPTTTDEA